MKSRTPLLVSFLAILLGVGLPAFAQHGPPPRELMLPRRIFYALRKPVAEDLKLTESGKQRIMDAFQGCLEIQGEGIRLTLKGGQNVSDMEQDALDTLSPDQRKQLERLWIGHYGGLTLLDDRIGKKVGLTADQNRQLDNLAEKGAKEFSDLMAEGPSPESRKKSDALRTEYGKKMAAVLTADQAKTFEGLGN